MAFDTNSQLAVAFKKLVGKAQTDSAKGFSNEAKPTGITTLFNTIIGEGLTPTPTDVALYDISNDPLTGNPVAELVRLELVADPSSNGHAFFARLPSDYESNSLNPSAGSGSFVNSQYLVDTAGQLQVITPLAGVPYEAKPYTGGTSAKGSGTLIPPGDPRDWYFDYFNGVFYQQDNVGATPTYIECFIYIGKKADESAGIPDNITIEKINGILQVKDVGISDVKLTSGVTSGEHTYLESDVSDVSEGGFDEDIQFAHAFIGNGSVDFLQFYLRKYSTNINGSTLIADIYKGAHTSDPNAGTLIASTDTVSINDLLITDSWINFNLSTPIYTNIGEEYWIIFRYDTAVDIGYGVSPENKVVTNFSDPSGYKYDGISWSTNGNPVGVIVKHLPENKIVKTKPDGYIDESLYVKGNTTVLSGNTTIPGATYDGSVICLGDLTYDGTNPLIIKGDLIVAGSFTSQNGAIIHGNVNVQTFISISGAGVFGVYGNVITGTGGITSTDGQLISCKGDLRCHSSISTMNTTGNGGNIVVSGDIMCNSSIFTYSQADGGQAGNLTCYGNVNCSGGIYTKGADGTTGNGGNAGTIIIEGDCYTGKITAYGGDAAAGAGNGGNGSTVTVDGDLIITAVGGDGIECWGGDSTVGIGGDGGTLTVKGSVKNTGNNFDLSGGDGNTGSGDGGNILCYGDIIFPENNIITIGGVNGTIGNAGSGGDITCYGSAIKTLGILAYGSGIAGGSTASNGGSVFCSGDITVSGNINLSAGYCFSGPPAGGNGGNLEVHGDLTVNEIESNGAPGVGAGNNGGSGGNILVKGKLFSTNNITVNGAGPGIGGGVAGNGGDITVWGFLKATNITSDGGPANSGIEGEAGNTYFKGGCELHYLYCRGLDTNLRTFTFEGECRIHWLWIENTNYKVCGSGNTTSTILYVGVWSGNRNLYGSGGGGTPFPAVTKVEYRNGIETGTWEKRVIDQWNTVVQVADTADDSVNYAASHREEIFTDTETNAFSMIVTLPSTPTIGMRVRVLDGKDYWATKNVTVARNGSNIDGSAVDFTCNVNSGWVEFIYMDSTEGWRVVV